MDARAAGLALLEGPGGALDVGRHAAGQRRDLDVHLGTHGAHGLEVALGRDGEPGLEDVHAEVAELVRHAQLLGHGHAATGRLLAVAQRGVEDEDAVRGDPRGSGHGSNLTRGSEYGKLIIIAWLIRYRYGIKRVGPHGSLRAQRLPDRRRGAQLLARRREALPHAAGHLARRAAPRARRRREAPRPFAKR